MSKQHQKHAKLPRPAGGEWGRLEIALFGAPCPVIERLAAQIINLLPQWKIGFVDTLHAIIPAEYAAVRFTKTGDEVSVHLKPDRFARRTLFNDCDLVLVNGNHFGAQRQVILLHPEKSLEGKLDRLSDVALVIAASKNAQAPKYLQGILEGVPLMEMDDIAGIAAFFQNLIVQTIPPLNGLILAGGQSLRMGSDKSLLQYHGKPQRERVFELLQPICREAFISCNAAQSPAISLPKIEDRFLGIGPLGGILSAFQSAPDVAWLTVAADVPHLGNTTLEHLIALRNPSKLATAFTGTDGLPEPLITIWEPKAYPVLLQALGQGISCPRKVLLTCDAELLPAPVVAELQNVNLPEEREAALAAIHLQTLSHSA